MNQQMETPKELQSLLSCKDIAFTNYKDLTKYVTSISKQHFLPFSSFLTGKTRKTQIFLCHFGGRTYDENSSKTDCQSYIKFRKDIAGNWTIFEANWYHNHRIDRPFVESHCNCCSKDTIDKIKQYQSMFVPPGEIRSSLNLTMDSNHFYNIRREVIKEQKTESLDHLLKSVNQEGITSILHKDFHDKMTSLTLINQNIANEEYAKNIWIVEDSESIILHGALRVH